MNELLLVIDAQNDFINENTKDTLNKIKDLIISKKYQFVVFTKFINSEINILDKKLGCEKCMTEYGSNIAIPTDNYPIFNKTIYSALNRQLIDYIRNNNIKKIYLCGFDTDACVSKTAMDLFESGYDVYVLKDYCACHGGKKFHDYEIERLKPLIGKKSII